MKKCAKKKSNLLKERKVPDLKKTCYQNMPPLINHQILGTMTSPTKLLLDQFQRKPTATSFKPLCTVGSL